MLAIKTLTPKSIIFRHEVRLMGTPFEISVVGDNPDWAETRINEAVAEINRVEKLLSAFNDDSAVNEINRNAGISPVKTNAEIFKLISRSLLISELTYGTYDITYITAEKEVDNATGIATKTTVKKPVAINYKNVVLDEKAQTVFLKEPNMRISLGANSKGYAADRAKYVLQMNGVSSGVINAGGDLLTWGAQPDNEPWTIATADPSQNRLAFADMVISNMAVATSVNAGERTPVINKKYAAAVKAKKGFQVSGIKSVSVISTTAELADAMATPIMAMGINAGLYLINQLNQIGCVIIDDQDRLYNSKDAVL